LPRFGRAWEGAWDLERLGGLMPGNTEDNWAKVPFNLPNR